MITLAVDAMGGDAGLNVTVPGAVAFLNRQSNVNLIMVGDEALVKAALAAAHAPMERITVQHASQVVEMDEAPQLALKNKKDSSMRIAINQVKEGLAQAAVSAGNTGALMATARFVLKTIPGIERPAIAKFLPSSNDHMTLMLDLGANVDCTEEQLMQFAVIGSELYQALYPENGRARVGLLNVGTEDIKGTETVKQTFKLLKASNLNFVGNVEGNAVFSG
ncbi:phosphate acyltransferase, partial [Neisseria dentiae]